MKDEAFLTDAEVLRVTRVFGEGQFTVILLRLHLILRLPSVIIRIPSLGEIYILQLLRQIL